MADSVAASYRALGLKPGATPEEVKQAYRDLIKIWHPDRFPHNAGLRAQAHTRTAELNAAYDRVQEHLRHHPAHPASDPSLPPPVYSPARNEPPLHPEIRADGSRRDYSNIRFVRCRRCGYRNMFPKGRKVLICRKCRHDPMRRPSPAPTARPAPGIRPPSVAHMVQPQHALPVRGVVACCGTLALISSVLGTLGLLPGVWVTGVATLVILPGLPGSLANRIVLGWLLFLLVAGLAILTIMTMKGERSDHRAGMGMCLLPIAVAIGATLARSRDHGHLGESTTIYLGLSVIAVGLMATLMACVAVLGLSSTGTPREWKRAADGLALGIVDMTAGAVTLMLCR